MPDKNKKSTEEFPKTGSFGEQKKFVDSLKKGRHTVLSPAVDKVKENPMYTDPKEIENGVKVTVRKHTFRAGGEDSKGQNELPSYSQLKQVYSGGGVSGEKPKKEMKTSLTFFHRGQQVPLQVKMGSDGQLKVYEVQDKKFGDLKSGLENNSSTGFIIDAKFKSGKNNDGEKDESTIYTAMKK